MFSAAKSYPLYHAFQKLQHKILVTGTTPDYIEWLRLSCPGMALFITHPDIRKHASEDPPGDDEEILVPLSDNNLVFNTLLMHLKKKGQTLDGIFSFDCESMELACFIARQLNLDYPSLEAVRNARDKYMSKQIWQKHQIECPEVSAINSVSEAIEFFRATATGCVLKPFTGSGSELVFQCKTEADCYSAFETIKRELENRTEHPLFKRNSSKGYLMLAEEYIKGPEYSCDFIVENKSVRVVRLAKKIKSSLKPFGTILGYILTSSLPPAVTENCFYETLLKGSAALGIERGICMADFIVSGNRIMLIEMTPRPGGDCLPHMLRECAGLDMLKISLDFAGKIPLTLPDIRTFSPCMAIRIHANKEGILRKIDCRHLMKERQVKSVYLTKKPGHRIKLPPKDYDSWLLGHVIISPSASDSLESLAAELLEKIEISIEKEKSGDSL